MTVNDAAKAFMLEYLSETEIKRPTDFEEEIIGGLDVYGLMNGRLRWNRTPFFTALTDLIDEGKAIFGEDEEGYWYKKQSNN